MKSDTLHAPLGRHFIAVEGEGHRVGQVTGFVHVADGPYVSLTEFMGLDAVKLPPVVVLDVCEAAWFPWTTFALEFAQLAKRRDDVSLVLETRGERWPLKDGMLALCAYYDEVYLNLTPGYTREEWPDFVPEHAGKLRVKRLLPCVDRIEEELGNALHDLQPYLERGHVGYVMPRPHDWANPRTRAYVREMAERFLALAFAAAPRVRFALVEHEILGAL
jgi:hypothetical protein